MPFFNFSIINSPETKFLEELSVYSKLINSNEKYFSKNTNLWRLLNKNSSKINLNYINYEKRSKFIKSNKAILFFLPPNIGLGDAVEYGLAIKSVIIKLKIKKYGIAFVEKYKIVFEKFFDLKNLHENIISEKDLLKFDTFFHFTLEVASLNFQKYNRSNIELSILEYFRCNKYRLPTAKYKKNKIDKITLYPISKSPIRTMPFELLISIINYFSEFYKIDVVMDNSKISNFIIDKLSKKKLNYNLIIPNNLKSLLKIIEKTSFGIFMDSGPLHIAKILNIKGVLILSSVKSNNLLKDFKTIKSIKSNYKSKFCNGPCGLTNAFYYAGMSGCYDSLEISKDKILKTKNKTALQRGNLNKKYLDLLDKPVNCLKKLDKKKVVEFIKENIRSSL